MLALALGKSVKQVQAEIDSQEFTDWLAFYRVHPWGEYRADLRMARIAATIVNMQKASDSAPISEDVFLFTFGEEATPDEEDEALDLETEQQQAMFMAMTKAMGGAIVERDDDDEWE